MPFDFRDMLNRVTPELEARAEAELKKMQSAALPALMVLDSGCKALNIGPELVLGVILSHVIVAAHDQGGKARALDIIESWRRLLDIAEQGIGERG